MKGFIHQCTPTSRLRLLHDNQVFDDFSSPDDDAGRTEGQDLANEFYKQLRERENNPQKELPQPPRQETEAVKDPETYESADITEGTNRAESKRKFTGQALQRGVSPPSSAGLFTGRGASVYSVPSNTAASPRQQMMENESRLVERSRISLLVQSVVTVALLGVAVFVGLTGGIEGNDWSSVPDSLDTNIEGIEGSLPIPVDSSQSIWL